MENTCWFFGDSFTYGDGCRPDYPYYELYPEKRNKLWTTLVSEYFNLNQINKGISGNSNPYIIKQILENLKNFKKGDFVIISDTLPIRLVHPNIDSKKIEPLTTDILIWPEENKDAQVFLNKFFKNNEGRKIVVEYIFETIDKKEDIWEEYYKIQFESIFIFLNNLGINTYFWSHRNWQTPFKYETIWIDTNHDIKNGHWSWKGHLDFSNDMITRIKNNEFVEKQNLI